MRFAQLLSLLLLLTSALRLWAQPPVPSEEDKAYLKLQLLSSEKLNIITSHPNDSLIYFARRVETLAQQSGNTAREFKAGQIMANAYGLSGNFGLAANKAQQMLEKAIKTHDHLATGLALQAIGATYMHSDRLDQADSVFTEARLYILGHGDPYIQIQLLFQHLNVYQNQLDTLNSRTTLAKLHTLIGTQPPIPGKDIYAFLLESREALYAIATGNLSRAGQLQEKLLKQRPKEELFDLWVHYIASQYYTAISDNKKALEHSDSTLQAARKDSNWSALRNFMLERANLLEKIGRDDEACDTYREVAQMSDSLFKTRYTSQIDSLHVTYWTDHLQMSNITRRNELYAKVIGGLLSIVLAALATGFFIRRKNRQLEASRQKLKSLQEASADSIRTKSLFLSNMSHELRTPLNGIVGFSTILTDEEDTDEETRQQCSNYIRQNGDLLLKLINDVVDFAKLQDQSFRFTAAPCDVVELCHNVLHTVDNVKHTEAQMHFKTDLEELEIQTDSNRLQQVLINLLVNATKFTSSGDITLSLYVDTPRGEAVFAVEDTGCGIPLDKQPSIFERFEKLHEGVQGAGLGLSICKLIVEYTGGRIWIDPSYTQGARFIFTHPLRITPKNQKA